MQKRRQQKQREDAGNSKFREFDNRHGAMGRRASVLECGSPLPLWKFAWKSGRGLAHFKTSRKLRSRLWQLQFHRTRSGGAVRVAIFFTVEIKFCLSGVLSVNQSPTIGWTVFAQYSRSR